MKLVLVADLRLRGQATLPAVLSELDGPALTEARSHVDEQLAAAGMAWSEPAAVDVELVLDTVTEGWLGLTLPRQRLQFRGEVVPLTAGTG